jgi:hypothetical protein
MFIIYTYMYIKGYYMYFIIQFYLSILSSFIDNYKKN